MLAEPKSTQELIEVINDCVAFGIPYKVLGRGSNLFIASEKIAGVVIKTTRLSEELEFCGEEVRVAAGVPLQKLLLAAADHGLGGLEYLHSVPGNLGGAIYMNAGRGRKFDKSISQHVVNVTYFDGKKVRTINNRRCRFAYRSSVFQAVSGSVIVGATIRMERCAKEQSLGALYDRIKHVKASQDNTQPNAGSVYRSGLKCAASLRGLRVGEAMFSEKTDNWILNIGGSASGDLVELLSQSNALHVERGFSPPELEWTVW